MGDLQSVKKVVFANKGEHHFSHLYHFHIKGTQMGPLLVLVCPCFRENVIFHIQNCFFLCSLDNFLLKNVIVFFFGKSNFKMAFIWKWAIFDLLFTFHKKSFSTYLTYTHTYTYFAYPIDFLWLINFAKTTNLSCMFSLRCDSRCCFFFATF